MIYVDCRVKTQMIQIIHGKCFLTQSDSDKYKNISGFSCNRTIYKPILLFYLHQPVLKDYIAEIF